MLPSLSVQKYLRPSWTRLSGLAVVLVLVTSALPFVSRATSQSPNQQSASAKRQKAAFVPGEVLVRFRSSKAAARSTGSLTVTSAEGKGIPLSIESIAGAEQIEGLRLARVAPEDTLGAVAGLNARTDVLYAEPNYILHTEAVPNDTRYSELYGLRKIGAEQAWNTTTGSRSIVVGVIDEGVDINHPDLKDNIWKNPGETGLDANGHNKGTNGIDDDGNGYVDDVNGWDFFNQDNTVFDGASDPSNLRDRHGTNVAGTIGATGNNGIGVAGVNWQVSLMPLKFIQDQGDTADAVKAVLYAKWMRDTWLATNGAKGANVRVLNNSYGGGVFSQTFQDAIKQAGDSGILFVAAAGGNDSDPNLDNDTGPHYPASYNLPNVLSVAATDQDDKLASFSHYGANTVHLGAPGNVILSTSPNNTYSTSSGTSLAAPHVAGTAALMCAVNPNISVQTLWYTLIFSTDPVSSLAGKTISGGRLNAANAVQAALTPDTTPPGAITNLHVASQTGRSVTLAWTASGDDGSAGQAAFYFLSFVDAASGAEFSLARLRAGSSGAAQSASVSIPYRHPSGAFKLRVFDKAGNEATPATVSVSVSQSIGNPYAVSEKSATGLVSGGSGIGLRNDDAYRNNYALPFSFPFFGQNYNSINISTNGALYFSTPPDRDAFSSISGLTSQRMIAGLWDDLRTDTRSGDDVYVSQPDANRIIFRWQGVTYSDENPVNFEIELNRNGTILERYGTGNAGVFPIVGISGGEPEAYVVNSHTATLMPISLANAQTVEFRPNYEIKGQVTGGGSPLSGIPVNLSGSMSATTTTDVGGNYSFNAQAGGNYTVTPAQTGFYTFNSQSLNNLSSHQTLNFAGILRTYSITGRVVDGSNGLGGITVNLSGTATQTTTTNDNGDYAFNGLPAGGNYTLTPVDNAFYSFTQQSLSNLLEDKSLDLTGTLKRYTISGQVTENGVGLSGVNVSLSGSQAGTTTTDNAGNYSFASLPAKGIYTVSASKLNYAFNPQSQTVSNLSANQTKNFAATPTLNQVSFSAQNYLINEGAGSIAVSVTRSGEPTGAVTVDYATSDGTAHQRTDYTTASGTLSFAAGERTKAFTVLVTDNAYVDGSRVINLSLSNPNGISLGTSTATLTITDNDTAAPTTNPIDSAQFFVRQHYYDFLNREPDPDGLAYWSDQIAQCGTDQNCINSRRIGVSAAYFIELEFQDTGSFVYRFYKASYGQRPSYAQFMPDRSRVVGGTNLEAGKQAFAEAWVQRPEFIQKYALTLTGTQFIDAMLQTVQQGSGVNLSALRQTLINDYNANQSRARIVRLIAEDATFQAAEYNRAFVLMQYFGYLRRDPDEGGYLFWVDVLNNRVANNYRGMVCAFLTSAEYQERFSPVKTRNDSICSGVGP